MSRLTSQILLFLFSGQLTAASPTPITSVEDLYARHAKLPKIMQTVIGPGPVHMQMMVALSAMRWQLRNHHVTSLDFWINEKHVIYFNDYFTSQEKGELTKIFNVVSQRVIEGKRDIQSLLVGAGSASAMVRLSLLQADVDRLENQYKQAVSFARERHEGENQQRYGTLPYSHHLNEVHEVLKRFGLGHRSSYLGLKLGTAAWLHDVLEDTRSTYHELINLFGEDISSIVLGVTKLKGDYDCREDYLRDNYERCSRNKGSRLLKVADRIANVETGLKDLFYGRPSIVGKYFEEWALFKQTLYIPGEAEEMWIHLERLLTDLPYAHNFVFTPCRDLLAP